MQPAIEQLVHRLEENGADWSSILEQWYREQWDAALQSGVSPDTREVLEVVRDHAEDARAVLTRVDDSYRPLWESRHQSALAATVDMQADDTERSPSKTPSSRQAFEATAEMLSDPEGGVAESAGAFEVTTDFGGRSKTAASRRKSHKIPERIGKYRIERVLGRGGMGVVYLAHEEGVIKRSVALKMILDMGRSASERRSRFELEAATIGRFDHNNIVRVYEFGEHEGLPYFSLEYVDGESLADRCREEAVTPKVAAQWIQAVADGVAYAHRQGIVHRDLKPANILLSQDDVPKLTDFGLAKQLETDAELSRDGAVLGTPSYMSPEQARGLRDVKEPADVYGLGATLYCLLTGRPPFVGPSATDTVRDVIERDPVTPRRLQATVPKDLETICLKCLEKEPERRYASAAELSEDLGRFLRDEPIAARPISKVEKVWRWCRRNPRVAIPSATAALLALALMIGGPITAGVIFRQNQVIGQEKERAESQKILAEDNANAARVAQGEAEKSSEAAQTQQKLAIDTLKMLVFEVQRELEDRPRLQDLRRNLLKTAREGLQLMEEQGGPPVARNMIAASTLRRLGDLDLETGRTDAAIRDYEKCLDILQSLDQQGQLPSRYHNLSTIHDLLSAALGEAGRLGEAEQHLVTTLEIRQAWLAAEPDFFVEQNVAGTLGDLGTVCMQAGKLEEAQQWYEQSAKLRKKFVDAKPNSLDANMEWIGSRWVLARVAFQREQWEAALEGLTEVDEDLRNIERQSNRQSVSWNAGKVQQDLGELYLYRGELAPSERHYSEAVAKLEKLEADDPENMRLREDLADALYSLAVVRSAQNETDSAAQFMERVVNIRRDISDIDRESTLRSCKLALALAHNGQLAEAEGVAEPIRAREGNNAKTLYDLACIYAQIGSRQQGDQAAQSLDQAQSLLEQAVAAGYSRQMDLKLDPELAPLRSLPIESSH